MSELSKVAFSESPSPGHPHDLLARLYREIGISAVAAALEVIAPQDIAAEPPAEQNDEAVPAIVRETRAA
jgi:hypothetical protein